MIYSLDAFGKKQRNSRTTSAQNLHERKLQPCSQLRFEQRSHNYMSVARPVLSSCVSLERKGTALPHFGDMVAYLVLLPLGGIVHTNDSAQTALTALSAARSTGIAVCARPRAHTRARGVRPCFCWIARRFRCMQVLLTLRETWC